MYPPGLYYLVGALRDGSVYKYNRNYYVIWYSSSKVYLQEVICEKLKKLGYSVCRPYQYKRNHYRVRISSKKLFTVIVEEFEHPVATGGKRVCWNTPRIVVDSDITLQNEYIKGFVDAEGSIIESTKGTQIDISQKYIEPLKFISKTLSKQGIKTTGIYKGKDSVWRLRIASYNSIQLFIKIIGFRHPHKKAKISHLLKTPSPQPSTLKGIGGGAQQGVEPAA